MAKGKVVEVRQLDNGDHAVQVEFGDGVERVLQLRPQYWLSDIRDLVPGPPKPSRRKPVPVHDNDTSTTGDGEDADSEAALVADNVEFDARQSRCRPL